MEMVTTKFTKLMMGVAMASCLSACNPVDEEETGMANNASTKGNPVQLEKVDNVEEQMTDVRQQIRDLIDTPYAENVRDCRVVGLGARPCGGPVSYVVYSLKSTDEDTLLETVETYNSLNRQLNQANDMVSTCEVIPEPSLTVRDGICTPEPMVDR